MGITGDRFEGTFEGHKIELVRTNLDKHVRILVDGAQLAEESVAIPHEFDLRTTVEIGGITRTVVAHAVFKKLFNAIPYDNKYSIEIDGKPLEIVRTK